MSAGWVEVPDWQPHDISREHVTGEMRTAYQAGVHRRGFVRTVSLEVRITLSIPYVPSWRKMLKQPSTGMCRDWGGAG